MTMGLKERARNWIFGGPRGDRSYTQTYSDGSRCVNELIEIGQEEVRINNNIELAKKYVHMAMGFKDLRFADRYEVIKESLGMWYERLLIDSSDNPVKSNEYSNLKTFWEGFTEDPISKRCFESIPNDYNDARLIDDFRGQLALFIKTNGLGENWYGKICNDFIKFYFSSEDNIFVMGQMAILLNDKRDSYVRADDYLKAYSIWARNWGRLDGVRKDRHNLVMRLHEIQGC